MTIQQANKIQALLEKIDLHVHEDNLINLDTIDEVENYLRDNDYFDVEIIYYSHAMNYLTDNDPSLRQSLELANDAGMRMDEISSEALASLLASEKTVNEFNNIRDDIEEIL